MTSAADLDELVDGIRERSEAAFSAVYGLMAGELLSFAFAMIHDRGAAEDVVQQAFLELARSSPSLLGNGRSLRAWLYRSVRFNCLDEIRRRTRRPEEPTDALPERPAEEDDPLPDPVLRAALMQLDERQREMVLLRHVVGCSIADIAEVVDSNRAAVYAALGRAERRLRTILGGVESAGFAASSLVDDAVERRSQ
jgi:RNA polymerase sigma-70 factor, ECF subfamily